MTLTLAEVEHISELARLNLTDDEKERFREQLSDILDYAGMLQSVDTKKIPPTFGVLPSRSILRPDRSHPGLSLDELFRNAPQVEQYQFRVPPVLE